MLATTGADRAWDLLGRPASGPGAMTTGPWTLWYEGEGEVGEDCDDPGPAVVDVPCRDVLVRGPAYASRAQCLAAGRRLRARVSEMDADDVSCRPTSPRTLRIPADQR